MQGKTSSVFSSNSGAIPVPYSFFSNGLLNIDSINELKVTLYIFFLIKQKRGYPRFVTFNELLRHNDITITARYLHLADDTKREKYEKYLVLEG